MKTLDYKTKLLYFGYCHKLSTSFALKKVFEVADQVVTFQFSCLTGFCYIN